jgi:hypothetical protein
VTALSVLNTVSHFLLLLLLLLQVGIPVDHHLLHMVEKGGLIVAAVGTVAATLGEILAVRALMRKEHDKTRQKVEAAAAAAVEALERAERSAPAAGEILQNVDGISTATSEAELPLEDTNSHATGDANVTAAAAEKEDGSCGWRWGDGRQDKQQLGSQGGGAAAHVDARPENKQQQ